MKILAICASNADAGAASSGVRVPPLRLSLNSPVEEGWPAICRAYLRLERGWHVFADRPPEASSQRRPRKISSSVLNDSAFSLRRCRSESVSESRSDDAISELVGDFPKAFGELLEVGRDRDRAPCPPDAATWRSTHATSTLAMADPAEVNHPPITGTFRAARCDRRVASRSSPPRSSPRPTGSPSRRSRHHGQRPDLQQALRLEPWHNGDMELSTRRTSVEFDFSER